jgi:RNA 3'-terminal phosphate cyclase (ATP)
MIDIDGSFGEGGGQILRTSLALALITGKAFHLRNVRANRARPGLQPQHVMSVQAAARVGSAHAVGATLRSSDLVFEPGPVAAGDYHFAIGTAGATGLVLHTIYLPLALADGPSTVTIEGGTHVNASPCFHFLDHTWRLYLARLGLDIDLTMERAGFYPRGGGKIRADLAGTTRLHGITLDDVTRPTRATVLSAVSGGLPESIAERQARRAVERLRPTGLELTVRQQCWTGGPGTMLGIELATAPVPTFFFALGARGKLAETVADETAAQAQAYLAAPQPGVDEHSADQLVLPLALAAGPSSYRTVAVTRHLRTNIAVIRMFLNRPIECDAGEGEPGKVMVG